MSYDSDSMMIAGAIAGMLLIIATFLAIEFLANGSSENKIMELGDEVATTDEYTTLFNESFSGHLVSIDKLYTVRDENGTERTFERHWLDKVDVEEVI